MGAGGALARKEIAGLGIWVGVRLYESVSKMRGVGGCK